ncbi:unnamed protein product [Pleuronectes platessa]|uniref:Uncharacterized protein n=1 Tax=Pleuronectes platessa TaxID=8262 RepID=A0A9N7VCB3_PLEPL|nr:unnamed protein product [Pleuronectes platessa]
MFWSKWCFMCLDMQVLQVATQGQYNITLTVNEQEQDAGENWTKAQTEEALASIPSLCLSVSEWTTISTVPLFRNLKWLQPHPFTSALYSPTNNCPSTRLHEQNSRPPKSHQVQFPSLELCSIFDRHPQTPHLPPLTPACDHHHRACMRVSSSYCSSSFLHRFPKSPNNLIGPETSGRPAASVHGTGGAPQPWPHHTCLEHRVVPNICLRSPH